MKIIFEKRVDENGTKFEQLSVRDMPTMICDVQQKEIKITCYDREGQVFHNHTHDIAKSTNFILWCGVEKLSPESNLMEENRE